MTDYFEGIIAISWLPAIFALVVIVHFFYSYNNYCLKKGFKVDYWHFHTAYAYIFTVFLMYPFSGSYVNFLATGNSIIEIREYVNKAFWITSFGYVGHYLGFYFYIYRRKKYEKSVLEKINDVGAKYINFFGKNKSLLLIGAIFICFLSLTGILYVSLKYGISFNMRGVFLSEASIRPLFNFWFSLSNVITVLILLRFIMYREYSIGISLFIIVIASVFSGTRSIVFSPLLVAYIFYLINKRMEAPFKKTIILGAIVLFFALYLGLVRSGNSTDNFLASIGLSIFYGNNFSDLRDFAWVLAYWDNDFLLGKSYLAGIMAFIPRSLSEFRETYSIGAYTNNFLGFDTTIHPGLRPGSFGEIYLNFGLFGVLLLGIVSGYIMKFTDEEIKKIVVENHNDYIKMHSKTFLYSIVGNFYITAGFWSLYVNLIILFLVFIARIVNNSVKSKPTVYNVD